MEFVLSKLRSDPVFVWNKDTSAFMYPQQCFVATLRLKIKEYTSKEQGVVPGFCAIQKLG